MDWFQLAHGRVQQRALGNVSSVKDWELLDGVSDDQLIKDFAPSQTAARRMSRCAAQ